MLNVGTFTRDARAATRGHSLLNQPPALAL